ncbi:MAG: CDP-alcohol phosphatidyltransferase family protein [Acidobacteriota bacterium]|nr:CDP-alcohol phosphatidyltransferase family protein [Acidobacteriota bacterium]
MEFKQLIGNATLANQLTFLRLVAVPFFIIAVINEQFHLAIALFLAAAVTDLLDGYVARIFHQGTALGSYLDPAADKLMMTAAFLLMTEYPVMFQEIDMVNRLPLFVTILAISRDVLIVLVALVMYLTYGQTRFRPTLPGKLTTLVEMITLCLYLLCNWKKWHPPILDWAWQIMLALILISGLHYLWRTVGAVRQEAPERPAANG